MPDATAVGRFRERLKALGLIDVLFKRFGDYLAREGCQAKQGQIVDASIVPAPVQRNSREQNRRIKEGEILANRDAAKRDQKDVDSACRSEETEAALEVA